MKVWVNPEAELVPAREIVVDVGSARIQMLPEANLMDVLQVLAAFLDFDVETFSDPVVCGVHDVEYLAPLCPDCQEGLPPRIPAVKGEGYVSHKHTSLHDLKKLRKDPSDV
jgi:hypothetical protein